MEEDGNLIRIKIEDASLAGGVVAPIASDYDNDNDNEDNMNEEYQFSHLPNNEMSNKDSLPIIQGNIVHSMTPLSSQPINSLS